MPQHLKTAVIFPYNFHIWQHINVNIFLNIAFKNMAYNSCGGIFGNIDGYFVNIF